MEWAERGPPRSVPTGLSPGGQDLQGTQKRPPPAALAGGQDGAEQLQGRGVASGSWLCPAAGPQAAFTTGLLSEGAARGRQPAASLAAPSPPGQAALTSRLGGGHGAPVEGRAVPRHGPHLAVAPDGDGGEGLVGAHVQPGGALETE